MVNVMKWIKRWCFLLALSLLVLPVRAHAAVYEGLDVSVWQGEIDFSQVKAAGKEMVYIRAGYGLSEDSRFRENAEGARRAGMKVGFYFFVTATNQTQARAQAVYFSELIREYPYDCRPAVDFEQYGTLSKGELNGIALAFAETLEERTGKTPVFYTNASSAAEIWEPALTRYPLWIADYGPKEPTSLGYWTQWAGFQYEDNGRVPGIAGAVDLDRFTEGMLLEQGAEMPFLDVRPQDWYAKGVTELFERGLLQGITPDRFGPDRPAQRAAVVTMLYRLAGEPPGSGPTGFSDVPLDAWYGKAVRWAGGIGIARGAAPGEFLPARGVSRQALAVFLYRYGEYSGRDVEKRDNLQGYADRSQVAPWAEEAVQWAVAEGILRGTGRETLAPQATADRAQMAVMVQRFLEK
ncbi:glycosyl hydrolase family 25 [Firmicutes bacterium CAG:114]|nr:glycosyl hydrolase family 25 [Firmicutes bacterium CAG:114]